MCRGRERFALSLDFVCIYSHAKRCSLMVFCLFCFFQPRAAVTSAGVEEKKSGMSWKVSLAFSPKVYAMSGVSGSVRRTAFHLPLKPCFTWDVCRVLSCSRTPGASRGKKHAQVMVSRFLTVCSGTHRFWILRCVECSGNLPVPPFFLKLFAG